VLRQQIFELELKTCSIFTSQAGPPRSFRRFGALRRAWARRRCATPCARIRFPWWAALLSLHQRARGLASGSKGAEKAHLSTQARKKSLAWELNLWWAK